MVEYVANGLVGFLLFFSHWLSSSDINEVRIFEVLETDNYYVIECGIEFFWNEQMSDIIDAGIPLRFQIISYSDKGDTLNTIRTLNCDISSYTYSYTDSLRVNGIDSLYNSKEYSHIFTALRKYLRWTSVFSKDAEYLHIEATLLQSEVSGYNRVIDLSTILNCSKYSSDIFKNQEVKKREDTKKH